MNKYKNIIAILFLSVLVTNCASVGNESLVGQKPEQVNSAIVKGKTTITEVKDIYGDPFETSFTATGTLIYKYRYDDTSVMNAKTVASVLFTYGLAGKKMEGTRLELVVLFDENNVVKNYNFSTSDINGGTGVFAKNKKGA
jgi:hypothetical protein